MSGIRAQNQELLKMGADAARLVERSKVASAAQPVVAHAGGDDTAKIHGSSIARVADLKNDRSWPDDTIWLPFTSLSAQNRRAVQVADAYRNKNILWSCCMLAPCRSEAPRTFAPA